MAERIVQLNFRFSVTGAEYQQAVAPLAEQFAALPGLRWKIWMIDESRKEAGGIYLFDDQQSARDYLEGPLAAAVTSHPALSDFEVKQFDIMKEVTAITGGPISVRAKA